MGQHQGLSCIVWHPLVAVDLALGIALALGTGGCAATVHQTATLEHDFAPDEEQGVGPTEAPGYVDPDIEALAVDFSGTCAWARSPGSAARYRVLIQVRGTPGTLVPVRADSRFDPFLEANVIGRLPSGSALMAEGPVHDASTGRTGYAVILRGVSGRVCRGYLGASAVTVAQ